MLIISGLMKVIGGFSLVSLPAIGITYHFLPSETKTILKDHFPFLETQYRYFLVSKTHPIRGSFYYSGDNKPVGTTKYIDDYKSKLSEWEKSSTSFYKSTNDLFTQNGKKNYKCAVTIDKNSSGSDGIKGFDEDCQIFSIPDGITEASKIIEKINDLKPVEEKLHLEYNKVYVLRLNLNNIPDAVAKQQTFNTYSELIVDVLERQSSQVDSKNTIVSLSLDNYFDSSGKFWKGKIRSILTTSKSKHSSNNLDEKSKTVCKSSVNTSNKYPCFAVSYDASKSQATSPTTLSDSQKYLVYFSSRNAEQISHTTEEYKYMHSKSSDEELITLTYEKGYIGFIDLREPLKSHLFSVS